MASSTAAFESWLQNKSIRDTAIVSLERLAPSRGASAENVLEIAISCIAIDLILHNRSKDSAEASSKSSIKSSYMFDSWAAWVRDRHKFENVILTEADADLMSDIMKGGDTPLLIRQKDGTWLIESLAYTSTAPKKDDAKKDGGAKKEEKKALSGWQASRAQDEIVKNKFYVRELKRVWQAAKNAIEQRIINTTTPSSSDRRNESKAEKRNASNDMKLLYDLGLNRIQRWIEEDEDKERHHKSEDERQRRKEALDNYSAWANQKEMVEQGHKMFKAGKKIEEWVEKYEVRGAREYWEQFEHAAALLGESRGKSRLKQDHPDNSADAEKAFEEWVVQKDMRDRAVEYLLHVSVFRDGNKSSSGGSSENNNNNNSSGNNNNNNSSVISARDRQRAVDVGRYLKRVDRTLYVNWAEWCAEIFTFNEANILWDFFDPIACDIHSATQVREVFMKVLKNPKIDFGEMFDEFVKKRYHRASAALNKEDMQDLLMEMGVNMRLMNVQVLIDAFDVDGNGTVSRKEFVEFAKPMKDKVCCWRTTCWKTGMMNAFFCKVGGESSSNNLFDADSKSKGAGGGNTPGEKSDAKGTASISSKMKTSLAGTRIVEVDELCTKNRTVEMLPERIKREKVLRSFGFGQELDQRVLSDYCDCKLVDRIQADREESLQLLCEMSAENRKEALLKKIISTGQPPSSPELICEVRDTYETKLTLTWRPSKDEVVSFYSLEYGGLASASKAPVYQEIFVNPKRADDEFQLTFTHTGLESGCSYLYRLRAFNGFGPGSYTYKKFTTQTTAPSTPIVLRLAHDSISLRWTFSEAFDNRLDEIRKIFKSSDSSGDGQLNRDELLLLLSEASAVSTELKTFFRKRAIELGFDASDDNFEAVFDEIESDDSGMISFKEFEAYLLSAGWCNTRSMALSASATTSKTKAAIRYTLERCTSEYYNNWEVALETSSGFGTISRLTPGQSYRFRVYSTNAEGVRGACSPSLVVHTMLEPPSAPYIPGPKGLGSTWLDIVWKSKDEGNSTRNPATVQKVIGNFAASHDEKDGGVSLEFMFSKYDMNKDGTIDPKELKNLLEDLGVGVSDDRLSDAFEDLDKDRNGEISYEEFGNWWRSDRVSYTVKIGEPVSGGSANGGSKSSLRTSGEREKGELTAAATTTAAASTADNYKKKNIPMRVIHRGTDNRHTVSGLEPNRLYHFKVRITGPRSNSAMSAPLVIMTAPDAPTTPAVVDVSSNVGHFKWYPPRSGCFSFEVQTRLIDDEGVRVKKDYEWTVVYNGQDNFWAPTTLTPAKKYEIRVFAINYEGAYSKPSATTSFTTANRTEKNVVIIPKNPEIMFAIEATDDICVGDTILITERIFSKDHMTKPPVPIPTSDRVVAARTGALTSSRPSSAKGGSAGAKGKEKEKEKDVSKKVASGGGAVAGGGSVRMDMSTTSIYSESNPLGKYIGQRTICAIVVKDNFRTIKGFIKDFSNVKKYGNMRNVWLEVMWEKLGADACKPYEHSPGDVIERKQSQLEQFEVYRKRWTDESARLNVSSEWRLLSDCFQSPDL